MPDAVALCVAGLSAVFAGMALLYLSIRVTAFFVDRAAARKDPDA